MQLLSSLAQGIGGTLDASLLDLLTSLQSASQFMIKLSTVALNVVAHVRDDGAHLVKLVTQRHHLVSMSHVLL